MLLIKKVKINLPVILLLFLTACSGPADRKTTVDSQSDTSTVLHLIQRVNEERFSNPDSISIFLDSAGKMAVELGYTHGINETDFWKAVMAYQNNQYSEAERMFSSLLERSVNEGNLPLKARCLERLASIHLGTDDPHLAFKLYMESLAISEKIGDSSGIARVYNILGIYKAEQGEFDTAAAILKKAIRINYALGDHRNLIENEGNLAYVYQMQGNTREAAGTYHRLIGDLRNKKDNLSLPVIYYNLASLHQTLNDLDSAQIFLHLAIDIAGMTGDTSLLSVLNGNTGEIHMYQKEYDSAEHYLERSVEYARAIDDVETEFQAQSFLLRLDSLTGKHARSFVQYARLMELKDSVYQRKIRSNLKETLLRYESEKKSNLIMMQELSLKSIRRINLLYVALLGVSVCIIALITFLIFQLRKNQQKDKILYENRQLIHEMEIDRFQQSEEINRLKIEQVEKDLQVKERELSGIALGIEQRNEILNTLSNKLTELNGYRRNEEFRHEINGILASLRIQMVGMEDIEKFNQQFSQIHHEFFTGLMSKHPDLTKTELKFCAYLKVNLSGNQIAQVLNVTGEAIRKTRYRIRKKLNLASNESLEHYISKF